MNKKRINIPIAIFTFIIIIGSSIIFFNGCRSVLFFEGLSVPISEPTHQQLLLNNLIYIPNKGSLTIRSCSIDLTAFNNYLYKDGAPTPTDSFRIYPALREPFLSSKKLCPMIARAKDKDDVSKSYIILDDDYVSTLNGEDVNDVKKYFQNYYEDISINDPIERNYTTRRRCRTYAYSEFDTYLLKGMDVNQYKYYNVRIEIGFVSSYLSSDFARDFSGQLPGQIPPPYDANTYFEGFTSIISLVLKTDGSVYDNRSIEIGKPCPPYCNGLDWTR